MDSTKHIEMTEAFGAHNYAPLDVVLARGEGVWVTDVEGRRYLDMLSAYSALNFGHRNARLHAAALRQMEQITLTSRAFYNDQLGPFCKELSELCRLDMVLPMNSGAEAVETAIKACRRWGYEVKGVPQDRAEIICMSGNFAGRTTTIVGFSTEEGNRRGFGPFTPGFRIAKYGDAHSIAELITPQTVGVLLEPIQGEAGIIIPPDGFLREVRELCTKKKILFIADEIQTGLCRTGALFACDHEQVAPDVLILGKSLGGGILPVSAVIGTGEVMEVFTPGSHGSTFGGNPLACAVGREVIRLIREEKPQAAARELGAYFLHELQQCISAPVAAVRGRGLFIGVDIDPAWGPAKKVGSLLKEKGVLSKDTRSQTLRFAPPLTITRSEIDWALERIREVFQAL